VTPGIGVGPCSVTFQYFVMSKKYHADLPPGAIDAGRLPCRGVRDRHLGSGRGTEHFGDIAGVLVGSDVDGQIG